MPERTVNQFFGEYFDDNRLKNLIDDKSLNYMTQYQDKENLIMEMEGMRRNIVGQMANNDMNSYEAMNQLRDYSFVTKDDEGRDIKVHPFEYGVNTVEGMGGADIDALDVTSESWHEFYNSMSRIAPSAWELMKIGAKALAPQIGAGLVAAGPGLGAIGDATKALGATLLSVTPPIADDFGKVVEYAKQSELDLKRKMDEDVEFRAYMEWQQATDWFGNSDPESNIDRYNDFWGKSWDLLNSGLASYSFIYMGRLLGMLGGPTGQLVAGTAASVAMNGLPFYDDTINFMIDAREKGQTGTAEERELYSEFAQMDDEALVMAAATNTMIYTVPATLVEQISFGMVTKMGKKAFKGNIIKELSRTGRTTRAAKNGVDDMSKTLKKYKEAPEKLFDLFKVGTKKAEAFKLLYPALTEGTEEDIQYLMDVYVKSRYRPGESFSKLFSPGELVENFYAGSLTGQTMGTIGGVRSWKQRMNNFKTLAKYDEAGQREYVDNIIENYILQEEAKLEGFTDDQKTEFRKDLKEKYSTEIPAFLSTFRKSSVYKKAKAKSAGTPFTKKAVKGEVAPEKTTEAFEQETAEFTETTADKATRKTIVDGVTRSLGKDEKTSNRILDLKGEEVSSDETGRRMEVLDDEISKTEKKIESLGESPSVATYQKKLDKLNRIRSVATGEIESTAPTSAKVPAPTDDDAPTPKKKSKKSAEEQFADDVAKKAAEKSSGFSNEPLEPAEKKFISDSLQMSEEEVDRMIPADARSMIASMGGAPSVTTTQDSKNKSAELTDKMRQAQSPEEKQEALEEFNAFVKDNPKVATPVENLVAKEIGKELKEAGIAPVEDRTAPVEGKKKGKETAVEHEGRNYKFVGDELYNQQGKKLKKGTKLYNKLLMKATAPAEGDEESYRGLPIVEDENIVNAEGKPGAAQYDKENGAIRVDRKKLKKKFKEKAWTKMRELLEEITGETVRSKAQNLPTNIFKTYEEFELFVMEHEYQHDGYSRAQFNKENPGKTKGDYETEINNRALEAIGKIIAPTQITPEEEAAIETDEQAIMDKIENGLRDDTSIIEGDIRNIYKDIESKDEIGYQHESPMATMESNRTLAEKIAAKLKEQFPFITVEAVEKLYDENGQEVMGMALGSIVKWSKDSGRLDTIPHEYFHIYFNFFSGDPEFQEALEEFDGDEEAFVQAVGEYYAGRIQDKGLIDTIKRILKVGLAKLKKAFGVFNKNDIVTIIGERFYNDADMNLGTDEQINSRVAQYQGSPGTQRNSVVSREGEQTGQDSSEESRERSDGSNSDSKGEESETQKNFQLMLTDLFKLKGFRQDHYPMVRMLAIRALEEAKSIGSTSLGFEIFYSNLTDRVKGLYPEALIPSMTSILKAETSEQKKYLNGLKDLYLRSVSSINVYSGGEEKQNGTERRYVKHTTSANGTAALTIDEANVDLANKNKKRGSTVMKNFIDLDAEQGRLTIQTFLAPVDRVYKQIKSKRSGFFWRKDMEFDVDAFAKSVMHIKDLVFVAMKGGGSGEMILSRVDERFFDMTEKEMLAELSQHVAQGWITVEHAQTMAQSARDLQRAGVSHAHGKILQRHYHMQELLYNTYLMDEDAITGKDKNAIRNTIDRLKIVLASGKIPYGLGNSKVMIGEAGAIEVEVTDPLTGELRRLDTDETDGWMISGKRFMKRLERVLGATPINGHALSAIKMFIRHRSSGGEDFAGFKMMNMVPFDGMKIYDKNTGDLLATEEHGYFITPGGQVFDHFATTNEAKLTAGAFKTRNEVIDIPLGETDFRVTITPGDEAKSRNPFFFQFMEQIFDVDDVQGSVDFIEAIKKTVVAKRDRYVGRLKKLVESPKTLRTFFLRDYTPGQELQTTDVLAREDSSGALLHINGFQKLIAARFNSSIIRDLLFSLRDDRREGSSLYYKPSPTKLEDDEIAISWENRTLRRLVLDKMQADGLTGPKEGGHKGLIKAVNNYLAENDVETFVYRFPIGRPTSVIKAKVKGFIDGGHGDTVFMNFNNVTTMEADSDGDKAFVQVVEGEVLEAYNRFLPSIQARDFDTGLGSLDLDIEPTSSASFDQFAKESASAYTGADLIGMVASFKAKLFDMVANNFAVAYTDKDGQKVRVQPVNMSKKNKRLVPYLKRGGKDVYMSPEQELGVLLQISVDDIKYGFWGNILSQYNNELQPFLYDRFLNMTKEGGKELKSSKSVNAMKSIFNNFGYGNDRQGMRWNRTMRTLTDNLTRSEQIKSLNEMTNENRRAALAVRLDKIEGINNIHLLNYAGFQGVTETLLEGLASINRSLVDTVKNYTTNYENPVMRTDDYSNKLHRMTVSKMYDEIRSLDFFRRPEFRKVAWSKQDLNSAEVAAGTIYESETSPKLFEEYAKTKGANSTVTQQDVLAAHLKTYQARYDSMTEGQKVASTLAFLTGATNQNGNKNENVNFYPPLDMMHIPTMKAYAAILMETMVADNTNVKRTDKVNPVVSTNLSKFLADSDVEFIGRERTEC